MSKAAAAAAVKQRSQGWIFFFFLISGTFTERMDSQVVVQKWWLSEFDIKICHHRCLS